jgi:hypothetical protein
MFGDTLLQLLLQVTAPMLISAQRRYFSLKIFEAGTCKTVDCLKVKLAHYYDAPILTYIPDLHRLAFVWYPPEAHLACFPRVR